MTLSGGECLLQAAFCGELLKALKQNGINTAVDTCGDVPRETIDAVLAYTDVFLYDIKALDEKLHLRCTGRSNRQILGKSALFGRQECTRRNPLSVRAWL